MVLNEYIYILILGKVLFLSLFHIEIMLDKDLLFSLFDPAVVIDL